TMPTICRLIMRHITAARRDFTGSQLFGQRSSMYLLLDKLELSVRYSLDKRAKAKALYDHPKWETS
ncbi:MAG TPA: hypothetical protein VNG90_03350, partial [Candidatus Acidoferrum sp.]|nr:hypothetical protein [Candidatus Acidoferrum sp.]